MYLHIYMKHTDMLPNDNIRHYTKKDIQNIYKVSLSFVDKQIASKQLGIIKIGKSVRIPRNELYKWLKRYNTTSASV
jgi:excisionase family DNA binding protein